jgi:hypothetical protein
MKSIFLIFETDHQHRNPILIGCYTAKSKALKEVINQVENKEGEISENTLEYLHNNLQTPLLNEVNYIIQERDTNEIF